MMQNNNNNKDHSRLSPLPIPPPPPPFHASSGSRFSYQTRKAETDGHLFVVREGGKGEYPLLFLTLSLKYVIVV